MIFIIMFFDFFKAFKHIIKKPSLKASSYYLNDHDENSDENSFSLQSKYVQYIVVNLNSKKEEIPSLSYWRKKSWEDSQDGRFTSLNFLNLN